MRGKILVLILISIAGVTQQSFAQLTILHHFSGQSDGRIPHGEVVSDGTYLYGMTHEGGDFSRGIIFKVKPDGSSYSKLFDFTGVSTGGSPFGSLYYDGTYLYGMTWGGGLHNGGTIFKIKTDGSGYVQLFDFAGTFNGAYPSGSLISDGTYLYGMTEGGGANFFGSVFKIKPDGTNYIRLHDFTYPTEYYPKGSLIYDGTFLYGMTLGGGTMDSGTVFKIKPDGTNYIKLMDFTDGAQPSGNLNFDGTYLYGMTWGGGVNTNGIIFKIKPDGSGYAKLHDFGVATSERNAAGSLFLDGTYLYGMTCNGGTLTCSGGWGCGTIFKIKPDGSNFVKLVDFDGPTSGRNPYGSFISDGAFLYGMASAGGSNDSGVVFKYNLAIGVPELTSYHSQFSIFPNPFSTQLTIHSKENHPSSITLSDLSGKILLQQSRLIGTAELNTEGIAAGLYFLRVEDGRGVSNYKVVKEN